MAPELANKNTPALSREAAPWTHWLETATHFAHFPLRVALASVFLFHGISKFSGSVGMFAEAMGLPLVVAFLVAVTEVGIGVAVIAGAFDRVPVADTLTRLAGVGAMAIMFGAIGMVHAPRWNFVPTPDFPMGGMELQFAVAMIGMYLAMRGNRI